jgi:hypothetical protein
MFFLIDMDQYKKSIYDTSYLSEPKLKSLTFKTQKIPNLDLRALGLDVSPPP